MENKGNKPEKPKEKPPPKETLEGEIKEAIEKEKEHVEEGQKIAEEQEKVEEIKQETAPYEKKETPKETQLYEKKEVPPTEYIENQEFYVKNDKDFDKIKNTMQEIKTQDSSMSKVDDSELWEFEPETKKLKVRKMPRSVLDMLKQKQIVLDYYKML